MFYRQCKLKNGKLEHVSWVPEKFAKIGKFISIKDSKGKWNNGYKVVEVGDIRLEDEEVFERSQDYKYQRKASDI